MGEAGVELDELPGQRRDHVPAAGGRSRRWNVAKIHQQRWRIRLLVDLAVEDLEANPQVLIVGDDARLRRPARRPEPGR